MSEMRHWKIYLEGYEDGDNHYVQDNDDDLIVTGTYADAAKVAEKCADEWEERTGGLVSRVVCESQGKVQQNTVGEAFGKWPGNETDSQIAEGLEAIE